MSRVFVKDDTEGLSVSASPITAVPFTWNVWFRATDVSGSENIWCTSTTGSNDDLFIARVQSAETAFWCRTGGSWTNVATTANGVSANTWHCSTCVATSTTDRAIFLDGTDKQTDTTSKDITGMNRTSLGVMQQAENSQFFEGRLAEATLWNVALSDGEVAALATGISPYSVRPANIVGYWPCYGVDDPEPDWSGQGNNMSLIATPTQGDHVYVAPVYGRDMGWQGAFTAAAAGLGIPLAMHHYKQMRGMS